MVMSGGAVASACEALAERAKKIGAALRDAEAALEEQARNRAEAEQHRIAGKQLVDAALREEYRAKQDGGSRKAVALWKKAVGEFEAGLRLARKKVTDDPNLVRAKHNSAAWPACARGSETLVRNLPGAGP